MTPRPLCRLLLAARLLSACPVWAEDVAPLAAEQITEENAAARLIGGPDAIGGVGDWYLANDRIEVIVDDPARRFATLGYGGTIVDAGLRDRTGEDQFARFFPIVNLDQGVFIDFEAIRAEVDHEQGWARLVVSNGGHMNAVSRALGWKRAFDFLVPDPEDLAQVSVETAYTVLRGEPFVHIETTLRNTGPRPAPILCYGDVWMRGGRSGRSWVGNTLEPVRSRGFDHLSFDRHNILAAGDAMAAFTHVSVPGVPRDPPIAYALFAPERTARQLRQFGVTGPHVTLINAFVGDPDWDGISLLRLAKATRFELAPGESWSYRRRLLVVGRADTASTTDVIFPLLGFADGSSGIAGRALPADVRTVVLVSDTATGAPITQMATEPAGAAPGEYRAILPPGVYDLRLRAAQRPQQRRQVTVSPGAFAAVPEVEFEPPGWLSFREAFADGGPGRIVFRGIGTTPDPSFDPELLGFRIDGRPARSGTATDELNFVGNASDPTRVAIAPGRYRLTAVRGFEYDVSELELEVEAAGSVVPVPPFTLARAITLPDAVRSDLHVHAEASDDTSTTNEARLRSMIAADIDVFVATDHDHISHYAPAQAALGVGDRIRVVHGVEVTSSAPSPAAPWSIGHHNAWPIAYQPTAHRQGAPPSQNVSVADLYASLRNEHAVQVVQLNHPRDGSPGEVNSGAYFTHLATAGVGYDPSRSLETPPNRHLLERSADGSTRAIDFDAIEVMNGASFDEYRRVRADWYSLLRQGMRRTGTANSDTHGPGQPAGIPRNYVALPGGAGAWDEAAWNDALRDGRSFGTNGPLLPVFTVNGGESGDLVTAPDGNANLEFVVAAAPWVPVDEVRLLIDGLVVRRYAGDELVHDDVVRLHDSRTLSLERDAFITLEAGAPLDSDSRTWGSLHGGVYADVVAPGFVPTAFANPIYVDADGNGRFDPPGLPAASPGWWPPQRGVVIAAGTLLLLVWWLRLRRVTRGRAAG
ncbi:MAG: CehA/McbA family metallohydrolase [Myxococcota bacterium]